MAAVMDAALAEIEAQEDILKPQHEGLMDYSRLNLQPGTAAEVAASITESTERLTLLNNAKVAIQALVADGHPEMPAREVEASVYNDLLENKSTIEAALTKFASNAPVSMAMSAGAAEPKSGARK